MSTAIINLRNNYVQKKFVILIFPGTGMRGNVSEIGGKKGIGGWVERYWS